MKFKSYSIFILLLFFCNSCATKALWDNTDPNKFVRIRFSQITEEVLIKNEVKYIKDNRNRVFYVEKDSFDKLKDYTYRVLGTPLTLVIDAVIVVVVAVGISGNLYIERGGHLRGTINL
jgi:hypothetical protein